jgi:transcription elongation factor GreA
MSMENEIQLTAEGLERLQQELEERRVRRDEIVEAIKEARGFGDLSENAEYDSARDEQARNEARIAELEQTIRVARIVEAVDAMAVSLGTTVEIEDARGRKQSYKIVGTTETNSLNHEISSESPAGNALLGHAVGDTVSFTTPAGRVREFKIVNISI